jgi:hypothetical protein
MFEADADYHAWVLNQRNHLEVVNRMIELAGELQNRERSCNGNDLCACRRRVNQEEGNKNE